MCDSDGAAIIVLLTVTKAGLLITSYITVLLLRYCAKWAQSTYYDIHFSDWNTRDDMNTDCEFTELSGETLLKTNIRSRRYSST